MLLPQFGVETRQSTCQRLRHRICRSWWRRRLDWSSLHAHEGCGEDETERAEKEMVAHDQDVVDYRLSGENR